MIDPLEKVRAYHRATKHHVGRFARGPGRLDWATQPDPFRRYQGARILSLDQIAPGDTPRYNVALQAGQITPQPLNYYAVSQLFFDSLAISAWKQAGNTTWALRVNPSSGNLHPTEGYLVCGPVPGLTETPIVAHYLPREHALGVRVEPPLNVWQTLTAQLPADVILVGLSSIHWREAWKYGERAFRYCQHDVGHALAAIGIAAAGLGWQATLLDDLGSDQIAQLLGLSDPGEAEPEHPDCLLAVYPQGEACRTRTLPDDAVARFEALPWQGQPNRLSPRHVDWPIIDEVATATKKPPTRHLLPSLEEAPTAPRPELGEKESELQAVPGSARDGGLRRIIRQRRSAVAMDPRGSMSRDDFYRILHRTRPVPGQIPFGVLPWPPKVHLALFVHRVEGLVPGLYFLLRCAEPKPTLQAAMKDDFLWQRPPSCPSGLDLFLLIGGDAQAVAQQLSCQQEIAADGHFSLGMIAEFEAPLQRYGAWFYRRLHWECGLIGQVLYLEAEATGVRGTGIGCFFDDLVHDLLGLSSEEYQSLYHFTVGHPIEDTRLTTLPAYPAIG